MEGEEFCGLGVPSGKCICWDKIRCCIYDLKTSRNNTLLGSGVWRGSLKWYPRVDGSVVLSTSTFYRLTFHVLWLISPKDLSEEEQREHKFSLTGKIIKLNVSTGYSRSSHEIDRNIRVIGTHRGDEVMKDNPLFLEVVHVMVLDVIIFNLRFSNLWNSWKYVKLYKDVLVWEFYTLSSDRLSLSGPPLTNDITQGAVQPKELRSTLSHQGNRSSMKGPIPLLADSFPFCQQLGGVYVINIRLGSCPQEVWSFVGKLYT